MAATKQDKPRTDFPLTKHGTGQWCKRINGKLRYFGSDAAIAERKYIAEREYWEAGMIPPSRRPKSNGNTLADMVNTFLTNAKARVNSGDLSPLSYRDYKWVGEQMLGHFGRTVDPTHLAPAEFAAFRNNLATIKTKVGTGYAPTRLTKTVTVTKMMFNWAYEMDVIDKPPKFGKEFKGASKKAIRKRQNENPKSFNRDELNSLIDKADPALKAMILMGINCGFGNNDISSLPKSAINDGWVIFPRPKTEIERRVKLWPETVDALEAMPKVTPQNEQLAARVFLTSTGAELVPVEADGSRIDKLTIRFRNLMTKCKCYRKGRSFYGLRHTFETVAAATKDQKTVDAIMGHADPSMAAHYCSGIEDDRLAAVTDHVRSWLFDEPKSDEEE